MWRQGLTILVVVLLVPSLGRAQSGPERLLAPTSQIYVHFDGLAAHKAERQQTAFGKMMQGDTGKFLSALSQYARAMLDAAANRADPQLAQLVQEAQKALVPMCRHGCAFGLEIRSIQPPQADATLVVTKGAADLLPFLQKVATLARLDLNEQQVGQRRVRHLGVGPVHAGWWNEGEDAVLVFGTSQPEAVARRAQGEGYGLGKNPLYRELKSFNEFTTCCRGYLDTAGLVKVLRSISPEVSRLLEELGLDGLKAITGQAGFDGPAHRTIIDVYTTGQRKGLLLLASQKTFTLADLPPMPPDITGFTAANMNLGGAYDVIVQGISAGVRIFAPDQADRVKEGIQQIEGLIGVKIGDDLFGSLGDLSVSYNSPGDGLLGLGAMSLTKVKNPQKLQRALEDLSRFVDKIPFDQVRVEKKPYAGVTLYEVHIRAPGQITLPTFAVHKGWLAIASYPQPIKGFILRANGELPAWKASKKLNETMAKLPKEFVSLSVSDPRAGVKLLLSAMPPLLRLANSMTQDFQPLGLQPLPGAPRFDVSLVPNPHEAVRYLFPTITISTDDGKRIRSDTRASIPLPF